MGIDILVSILAIGAVCTFYTAIVSRHTHDYIIQTFRFQEQSKFTRPQAIKLANVRKRTFGHVHPAKTQISLRIRAVLSEFSLGAFWIVRVQRFVMLTMKTLIRLHKLIWVFVGRTCQKVRFLTLQTLHAKHNDFLKCSGPEVIKLFFMLNSAEHEIFHAYKSQIANNAKFFIAKHSWAWKFLC